MAGLTNWPFRRLALENGAGLAVTEMVSAMALAFRGAKTLRLLKTDPRLEKPFCVQLFGKDPDVLAEAARIAVDLGADLIDLNFGCPARKVVRSGHGAAILRDFQLAETLVRRTAQAVAVPVTVKTRIAWAPGWPDVLELAPRLLAAGVAAIALHGRYATQGFAGTADWDKIRELAEKTPLPVIGSGDLTTAAEAVGRLKASGAAGVMIGRAARGRPWLFRQCLEAWAGREPAEPTLAEKLAAARSHALWLLEEMGPKAAFPLRTVLVWYVRDLPGSAALRAAINQEERVERQLESLERFFAAGAQSTHSTGAIGSAGSSGSSGSAASADLAEEPWGAEAF
jgi:nifR3 family TIM-barrel protein